MLSFTAAVGPNIYEFNGNMDPFTLLRHSEWEKKGPRIGTMRLLSMA